MDFNASKEIWRFFSQYQLNELTSTDDITQANADIVRVFPNPSAAAVNLVFESDGVKHIRITNAMGQIIENYSHASSQAVWNAPASGIYFITVQNGSQVQTLKFIKE
jgi:polyhydroxybutyrate depolymerase